MALAFSKCFPNHVTIIVCWNKVRWFKSPILTTEYGECTDNHGCCCDCDNCPAVIPIETRISGKYERDSSKNSCTVFVIPVDHPYLNTTHSTYGNRHAFPYIFRNKGYMAKDMSYYEVVVGNRIIIPSGPKSTSNNAPNKHVTFSFKRNDHVLKKIDPLPIMQVLIDYPTQINWQVLSENTMPLPYNLVNIIWHFTDIMENSTNMSRDCQQIIADYL